jgi:cytochrome P450
MRHPAALRKAQAEVRHVLARQNRVPEDALPKMHYLQLVIKETLRLHAAVPLARCFSRVSARRRRAASSGTTCPRVPWCW